MTTILIVEDDPAILQIQAELFGHHGFHVLTAASVRDALAVLSAERVDVLFSDVRLDGSQRVFGIELAHEAQVRYRDLAVVLATGYDSAAHNGCIHWHVLHKPYMNGAALRAVQEAIEHARARLPPDRLPDDEALYNPDAI